MPQKMNEATQPTWLPALHELSLSQIAAIDDTEIGPSVEGLYDRVASPTATVGGSQGS